MRFQGCGRKCDALTLEMSHGKNMTTKKIGLKLLRQTLNSYMIQDEVSGDELLLFLLLLGMGIV